MTTALLGRALPFILLMSSGPASAKILFKAGFETGDLSEWANTGTRSQNATPRNIELVTDVVHQGKYAAKVTIHGDDVFNAQQLRVQMGGPRVTVQEGSDTYMSFYMYMAEAPKDRDNFFYWEGNPPPRYNNVMTWWVEPKPGGGALIKYGTGNLGRNGTHWEADFPIGKWHQVAMHVRWSEDPEKGNTRLWFDGNLVLDKKLKTKGAESVYFCQPGIHRTPHRASVDSIYFDSFVLADTLEEVVKLKPLDANASDPVKLQWMVGAPPPPDKRITYANGNFFHFPESLGILERATVSADQTSESRAGRCLTASQSATHGPRLSHLQADCKHGRVCLDHAARHRQRHGPLW